MLHTRHAKVDLLYVDDFGIEPMSDQTKRDLLEILEDRYDKRSTMITSQIPVDRWHAWDWARSAVTI